MKTSDTTKTINEALFNFQKEITDPQRKGYNPGFKSKYATLDDTIKAIREQARECGLSFVQSITGNGSDIGVYTRINHSCGEWIETDPFVLHADKPTPQGAGSAITYARRYSLAAAFGLATDEDDDGNGAEDHAKKQKEARNKEATLLMDKPVEQWSDTMIGEYVFNGILQKNGERANIPVSKLYAAGENGAKLLDTLSKREDLTQEQREVAERAAVLCRLQ